MTGELERRTILFLFLLSSFSGCIARVTGVPECKVELNNCQENATCVALADGNQCVCDAGYEEQDGNCVDIDGCALKPCFAGVRCSDISAPGTGFTCDVCPSGYEGDGETCTDINGCADDPPWRS